MLLLSFSLLCAAVLLGSGLLVLYLRGPAPATAPQQQPRGLFSPPWGNDQQRQPQPMARGLFGPWPWGQ